MPNLMTATHMLLCELDGHSRVHGINSVRFWRHAGTAAGHGPRRSILDRCPGASHLAYHDLVLFEQGKVEDLCICRFVALQTLDHTSELHFVI